MLSREVQAENMAKKLMELANGTFYPQQKQW